MRYHLPLACSLLAIAAHAADAAEAAAKPLSLERMTATMVAQSKYMLWDGDLYPGAGTRWWTHPTDRISGEIVSEGAHSGKRCIVFHGDGGAWLGFGINVSGWWPKDAVHDVSNYRNLSFWIRIEAAPGLYPNRPNLHLTMPGEKDNTSNQLDIEAYAPALMDGQWHEVVIPLKHLRTRKFDLTRVWELGIGTWAPERRCFDMYLDEIGFDNRSE